MNKPDDKVKKESYRGPQVPIVFAGPSVAGKSLMVSQLDNNIIPIEGRGKLHLQATEKYVVKYDPDTAPRDVIMGLKGQKKVMLLPAEFQTYCDAGKFLMRYDHFGQDYAIPSEVVNLVNKGKSPLIILNQKGVDISRQHDFFNDAIYFLLYCTKYDYQRRMNERGTVSFEEISQRLFRWEEQMRTYDGALQQYDVVLETSPHLLLNDDIVATNEDNVSVQRAKEAIQLGIRSDTHSTHIDNLLETNFKVNMEGLMQKYEGSKKRMPICNIDELIEMYLEENDGISKEELKDQTPPGVVAVVKWHGVYEIVFAKPPNYTDHSKQHMINLLSMLFGTPSEKFEHQVFEETTAFSYCRATSDNIWIDHIASFGYWDRFIPDPYAKVRNLAFSVANVDKKLIVGTDMRNCDLYKLPNTDIRAYRYELLERMQQMERTAGRISTSIPLLNGNNSIT